MSDTIEELRAELALAQARAADAGAALKRCGQIANDICHREPLEYKLAKDIGLIMAITTNHAKDESGRSLPLSVAAQKLEEVQVRNDKQWRKDLDAVLQQVKAADPSRERALAVTKIQEAIMWLGMDLKRLNDTRPYPESYNPASPTIEPTADGLKM